MILSQIKSLEIQPAVLKKQCEQQSDLMQPCSLADFYGIAGPADIVTAEIDAVLYHIDESGFEVTQGAMPQQ